MAIPPLDQRGWFRVLRHLNSPAPAEHARLRKGNKKIPSPKGTPWGRDRRVGESLAKRLRRLLSAAGTEPVVDAALEAREGFQALPVRKRQQLHQDHAADVARRIDPVIGVGEPSPGEAAGAAAFSR